MRITVVFRGSAIKNDWRTDLKILFTDMKLRGPGSNEPIIGKVHEGFNNYPYRDTKLGGDERKICKTENILGELQALVIVQ